jgi:hypothetical protein
MPRPTPRPARRTPAPSHEGGRSPATSPRPRTRSGTTGLPAGPGVVGDALERLAGGVLVLDENLAVVARSPSAEALFGSVLPTGASAPALLCGDHAHRPVAEALAAGKPVEAVIPRPDQGGFVHLRFLTKRSTKSPPCPSSSTGCGPATPA